MEINPMPINSSSINVTYWYKCIGCSRCFDTREKIQEHHNEKQCGRIYPISNSTSGNSKRSINKKSVTKTRKPKKVKKSSEPTEIPPFILIDNKAADLTATLQNVPDPNPDDISFQPDFYLNVRSDGWFEDVDKPDYRNYACCFCQVELLNKSDQNDHIVMHFEELVGSNQDISSNNTNIEVPALQNVETAELGDVQDITGEPNPASD